MKNQVWRIVLCTVCALGLVAGGVCLAAADWQSHVSPQLLAIWKSSRVTRKAVESSAAPVGAAVTGIVTGRFDAQGRLQIDVEFDCANDLPLDELQSSGMVSGTALKVPPMCVVEGWAATGSLPAIASIAGVKKVDLPRYAKAQGAVMSRHPAN